MATRESFEFKLVGREQVKGRDAIVLEFQRIVVSSFNHGRTGTDKGPELLLGGKVTFEYGAFPRFDVDTPDASLTHRPNRKDYSGIFPYGVAPLRFLSIRKNSVQLLSLLVIGGSYSFLDSSNDLRTNTKKTGYKPFILYPSFKILLVASEPPYHLHRRSGPVRHQLRRLKTTCRT